MSNEKLYPCQKAMKQNNRPESSIFFKDSTLTRVRFTCNIASVNAIVMCDQKHNDEFVDWCICKACNSNCPYMRDDT